MFSRPDARECSFIRVTSAPTCPGDAAVGHRAVDQNEMRLPVRTAFALVATGSGPPAGRCELCAARLDLHGGHPLIGRSPVLAKSSLLDEANATAGGASR